MKRIVQLAIACLGGLALVLAVLLLINRATPVQANPGVLYVAPGGNCNGASPCYESVQAAVDAAFTGDEILVAAGTYTGVSARGGMTQVVYISETVNIRGGYAITDWGNPNTEANLTLLDAQRQGRVLYIVGSISPTIEGVSITGGDVASDGGGIRIEQAVTTISNSVIFSNTAEWGAGIALWNSPSHLTNNTIRENVAQIAGGGLGLSNSDATLTANAIQSNTAAYSGGGIYLSYSNAKINGNIITGNSANTLFLWHSDATLNANTIANGETGVFLHASKPSLTNNVIVANRYSGIYIEGASPLLLHNTIAHNDTGITIRDRWQDSTYYSSTVELTNTILANHYRGIDITDENVAVIKGVLWDSNMPITISRSATATVIVQNEYTGDPAFIDSDNGDFHIGIDSAAIDQGIDENIASDIDNEPRPVGTGYDLGADELMWSVLVNPDTNTILVYTDTQGSPTTIQISATAVTEAIMLAYVPVDTATPPLGFSFAGHAFELDAYRNGELLPNFIFEVPVTITIHYTDTDVTGQDEETLALSYWNGSTWVTDGITLVERNIVQDYVIFEITHLSEFALFGETLVQPLASIEKLVTPTRAVNYSDELTYTLLISSTPGMEVGLYDLLEGTTLKRFVEQPNTANIVHTNGIITGTLMVSPTNQVIVSFVVEVGIPGTAGWTVSVTNKACVYPLGATLDDCVWSNEVMNDAFRPHSIFLPMVLRN